MYPTQNVLYGEDEPLPSAAQHEPPLVGLWAGVGAVVEGHVDDHLQNDDALHVLEPYGVYPLQAELYGEDEPQHL